MLIAITKLVFCFKGFSSLFEIDGVCLIEIMGFVKIVCHSTWTQKIGAKVIVSVVEFG